MLQTLMTKWKVGRKDLFPILLVFAVTGFTTAYLSRSAPGWLGFTSATHWAAKLGVRLGILLIGYQLVLLTVAFLFGQFPFFWRFEKKLLTRLGLMKPERPSAPDS